MSPSQGPIDGGTIVTVKGANFAGALVQLDSDIVAPLSQTNDEMQLKMPKHDNGYVVISARTANGVGYGEFLYIPPPLQDLPPGYITTVAGVGSYLRTFGPANQTTVLPGGLAYDAAGYLYIAEANQHRVTRVVPNGDIELFASGNQTGPDPLPENVPPVDGVVGFPPSVATNAASDVFISTHGPRLRKVDARTGLISTITGTGTVGFSGDGGPASVAGTGQITYLAVFGSNLYFIDFDNTRVRRIDANGIISTYAGNGTVGFSGDGGPATSASFDFGSSDGGGLAVDASGNLYILDAANVRVRRVDSVTGTITTFARPSQSTAQPDVNGSIVSLAVDHSGNVYYGGGGRIVKRNSRGDYLAAWGRGFISLASDAFLTSDIPLGQIIGMTVDRSDNVIFSDDYRVWRVNFATNRLETIAGIGPALLHENGPAIAAPLFNENNDLAFTKAGELLIADGQSARIRSLDRAGNLRTVAGGNCQSILTQDGALALDACMSPYGLDVNDDGSIDIATGYQVGQIGTDGRYRLLAGRNPNCGLEGDGGPAREALLCQPWDTARDSNGNLYIADTNNNRIRHVDPSGNIATIAGGGGPRNGFENWNHGTYCGDGGAALTACLNTPYGVAISPTGDLYVSEGGRIRRIDRSGVITTFAQSGPISKIILDRAGFLYGARYSQVIRYDAAGREQALAGNPTATRFGGDGGPASEAGLAIPGQGAGIAIDNDGNLFINDGHNRRVRGVRFGAVLAPPNATIQTTASGSAIRATVLDDKGRPAPGVRVDFAAPSSGASCTLSNSFAITDANGVASVTCTPNCLGGTYIVTARPLAASSLANISFTNLAGPCRRRSVHH